MFTILLVDASPVHVESIRRALPAPTYRLLHVESPADIVDTVIQHGAELILMDVFGPEMDGFTATRILSKDIATTAIPVIMVASPSFAGHRIRAIWNGANEFLIKPLSETELSVCVGTLLQSRVGEPSLLASAG